MGKAAMLRTHPMDCNGNSDGAAAPRDYPTFTAVEIALTAMSRTPCVKC